MARGLFVTGTDTGVGKTLVSCAIASALHARGVRVGVYKPVETGVTVRGCDRIGEDCERLAAAAGGVQRAADIAGYLFLEPAAPLPAAEAEGVTIEPPALRRDVEALGSCFDFVLVESAGGLLVPITDAYDYRDLARDLALPVLCVVANRLGCINHARLTLEAIAAAGAACAGYVLNHVQDGDAYAFAARTNADVLRRTTVVPCLGALPYVAGDTAPARLAELAERHLDLSSIV